MPRWETWVSQGDDWKENSFLSFSHFSFVLLMSPGHWDGVEENGGSSVKQTSVPPHLLHARLLPASRRRSWLCPGSSADPQAHLQGVRLCVCKLTEDGGLIYTFSFLSCLLITGWADQQTSPGEVWLKWAAGSGDGAQRASRRTTQLRFRPGVLPRPPAGYSAQIRAVSTLALAQVHITGCYSLGLAVKQFHWFLLAGPWRPAVWTFSSAWAHCILKWASTSALWIISLTCCTKTSWMRRCRWSPWQRPSSTIR